MNAPRRPAYPSCEDSGHGEPERLAQAMATLAAVFDDIGRTITSHAGERCPYRTARDACTFSGGCQNQRWTARGTEPIACGGDGQLQWPPQPVAPCSP